MNSILNTKHGALNILSSKNQRCSLLSGISNTRCKKQHRSSHLLSANKRNSPKCEATSVFLLRTVTCCTRTPLKLLHIRTGVFVCVRGFVPVLWWTTTGGAIYTASLLSDVVYYIYFSYRSVLFECRYWTDNSRGSIFQFRFAIKLLVDHLPLCSAPRFPLLTRLDLVVSIFQPTQVLQDAVNDTKSDRMGAAAVWTTSGIPLIFLGVFQVSRIGV